MKYNKIVEPHEDEMLKYTLNNSPSGQYLSIKNLEGYFSTPRSVENSVKTNVSYPLRLNFSGEYGDAGGSDKAIRKLWKEFGLEYK